MCFIVCICDTVAHFYGKETWAEKKEKQNSSGEH